VVRMWRSCLFSFSKRATGHSGLNEGNKLSRGANNEDFNRVERQ
jgi:hypothetical protein